jgi:hypothetical protein
MSDYSNFTIDDMFEAVRDGGVSRYEFEEWLDQRLQDRGADGYDAGYYAGYEQANNL